MSNQKKACPICPNHCVEDDLHCEKGKSYFQGNHGDNQQRDRFRKGQYSGHDEHGSFHGKHQGHFDKNFPEDSLPGALMQCGHYLFRYMHDGIDDKEVFSGLSDSEKEELKGLLTKLLASWNGENRGR